MSEVTQILNAIGRGEPHASAELLPLVYDELRRLAARELSQEKPGQTLQATALVHEAWLRLAGSDQAGQRWEGQRHFFSAAAEAMRRILVENARRRPRPGMAANCSGWTWTKSKSLRGCPMRTCWPCTKLWTSSQTLTRRQRT